MMRWIRNGMATGIAWCDPASGWRELEDGTANGGAMFTSFFRPAAVGLPDDFLLVGPDEIENLARVVGDAAARWNRRIRVALGPALSGNGAWGRWIPGSEETAGWVLLAVAQREPEDRERTVWHELWHAWCDLPTWPPGEEAAIRAHGERVRAAWRARPDPNRKLRSWRLAPEEAEAVTFAAIATGGVVPAGVPLDVAAEASFRRIAGQS